MLSLKLIVSILVNLINLREYYIYIKHVPHLVWINEINQMIGYGWK